jgi:hypothetical protein
LIGGAAVVALGVGLVVGFARRGGRHRRQSRTPRGAGRDGTRGEVAVPSRGTNGGAGAATTSTTSTTAVIPAVGSEDTALLSLPATPVTAGSNRAGRVVPPDTGRPGKLRRRVTRGARRRKATGSGRGSEPVAPPGGGREPAARPPTPALATHAASAARNSVSGRAPGRDLQTWARPAAVNGGPQGEINH